MNYNDYKGCGIPKFPSDSRVCFLGDSLTAGGIWTEMIFEYYLSNFKSDNIRMYNVGIGGGTARYEIEHLDEDLMRYRPTHVVVMYSVNDIGGYGGDAVHREACFYDDMKELTELLRARGITVYYMCPMESPTEGTDEYRPRRIAHDVMLRLAMEYDSCLCDLYTYMTPFLERAALISDDRTHHTECGNCVLGRIFLHAQGFDGFSPEEDGFFDPYILSYEVDHRRIFNEKIRRVWCTMRNISTVGDTTEAKISRLYGRIKTRADGAWDDFCYYRAVDFIELYPNLEFYYEMEDMLTERLMSASICRKLSGGKSHRSYV